MPGDTTLRFDVLVSDLAPVQGPAMPNGGRPYWSPLAHTLIHGAREAAIVDPPITVAQTDALADWIESFDKRLSYIYITHWHADHWLGTGRLVRRFPGVMAYASPRTVERIMRSTPDGVPGAPWPSLFPGQLGDFPIETPIVAVPSDGFTVDGQQLVSVEAGHSDTDDSTVLHVPSIGLVAAGDVVYNNVHQYLAESPDGTLDGWRAALDTVAALDPAHVVAGHRDPTRDDDVANIGRTREYLDVAAELLAGGPSREEWFFTLIERYPDRINPYTVWLSAQRLLPAG